MTNRLDICGLFFFFVTCPETQLKREMNGYVKSWSFLMVWQSSPARSWEPVWLLACWNEVWKPGPLNAALACTFQALCWAWVRRTDSGTVTLFKTFSLHKLIQEVLRDFSVHEEINHSDLWSTLLRGFLLGVKYLIYLRCISGPCSFSSHYSHVSDTPWHHHILSAFMSSLGGDIMKY